MNSILPVNPKGDLILKIVHVLITIVCILYSIATFIGLSTIADDDPGMFCVMSVAVLFTSTSLLWLMSWIACRFAKLFEACFIQHERWEKRRQLIANITTALCGAFVIIQAVFWSTR